jgi:hypothetical protein
MQLIRSSKQAITKLFRPTVSCIMSSYCIRYTVNEVVLSCWGHVGRPSDFSLAWSVAPCLLLSTREHRHRLTPAPPPPKYFIHRPFTRHLTCKNHQTHIASHTVFTLSRALAVPSWRAVAFVLSPSVHHHGFFTSTGLHASTTAPNTTKTIAINRHRAVEGSS